jgi:hypothetical protein
MTVRGEPGSDALIIISRSRGAWRDIARSYRVMLDGDQVAKVRRGQTVELPVTPGRHEVFLQIDWCSSPVVEVDAHPREIIKMICEPGGNAFAGLQDVTARTDTYISLTRVDPAPF